MCTKYVNPKGTVFIKCDKVKHQTYLLVLDATQGYESQMNFCPNCGEKLARIGA